ncbi:disease resistance RPP13-like protein 4 [Aristolochia californica]|uniref:disease resistance RPP13-like protein 4 n=1 Tax=Aristolochia californica TaxID=171875 RepID=UPI0035D5CC69
MDEGGETGIAHKFFYDTKVELDFGVRIWVSFSQELELLKDILDKINEGQRREYEGGDDRDRLLDRIHGSLLKKKFLLVLNDVVRIYGGWWDRFLGALPKGNGSCVIVTTQYDYIAKEMRVVDLIYRPSEENWFLFSKIAFEEKGGKCRDVQLVEVAKEIVVRCMGIRIAIELMAGLMRHTPPRDWRRVVDNVDQSVLLIYHILPLNLKRFMSLFFLFPESMTVEVERLVYWWVGGGFASAESGKTALESAYDSLSELVSRRFVNVVDERNYDGRIYTCTSNLKVQELSDGSVDNILEEIGESTWQYVFVPNSVFSRSGDTGPTVVDLSFARDFESKDKLNWICSLEHLRCLILKGLKGIKELPHQFKMLQHLQLLILTDCTRLQTLPAGIMTLKNLTVLDIENCTSLRYLPKGLGTLSNLQVLSGFRPAISTSMDGSLLKDLENLTQLRILRLCVSEENQIHDVEVDLSSLEHLKLLDITIENSREVGNLSRKLDQLSPPACLRQLYLRGLRREIGPTWLKPARLPHLEYLCIENGNLKVLSINTTEKWKVEGLYLKMLPRLELEWRSLRSAMPCLKYVEVSGCYLLKGFELPYVRLDGIWRLPKEEEEEEIRV